MDISNTYNNDWEWKNVRISDVTDINALYRPIWYSDTKSSVNTEVDGVNCVEHSYRGSLNVYNVETRTEEKNSLVGIQPKGIQFGTNQWGKYYANVDLGEEDKQHKSAKTLRKQMDILYAEFKESVTADILDMLSVGGERHEIKFTELVFDNRYLMLGVTSTFWDQNVASDLLKQQGLPRQISIYPTVCWLRVLHTTDEQGPLHKCRAGIKWHLGLRPKRAPPLGKRVLQLTVEDEPESTQTESKDNETKQTQNGTPPTKKARVSTRSNKVGKWVSKK